MIFGIEFQSPYFQGEQLEHLRFLPNIEEIQLSDTNVTDDDLKWLVELPKLEAIGLNGTAISNRGVEILSESKSLQEIQVDETKVTPGAMQRFLNTR